MRCFTKDVALAALRGEQENQLLRAFPVRVTLQVQSQPILNLLPRLQISAVNVKYGCRVVPGLEVRATVKFALASGSVYLSVLHQRHTFRIKRRRCFSSPPLPVRFPCLFLGHGRETCFSCCLGKLFLSRSLLTIPS